MRRTGFRHELLLYAGGDHGFLEGTLEPVAQALAHEVGVLVAVSLERASALEEALGDRAQAVRFLDGRELGRNPARLFGLWQEFVREHGPGARASIVGISEPAWAGRSPAELSECDRHEALLNHAFDAGPGWHLLCPYDVDGLDEHVIEAAKLAHPLVTGNGADAAIDSHAYTHRAPRPFAGSLPKPQAPVETLSFAGESLMQVRQQLSAWAQAQGLGDEGAGELVLAVNELATNSVSHGGGAGTLCCWREDGALLCEVQDAGAIHAPLTGRVRPQPEACSGRGLWLINQLCDLVQIRSGPTGSVVRVHKRLP